MGTIEISKAKMSFHCLWLILPLPYEFSINKVYSLLYQTASLHSFGWMKEAFTNYGQDTLYFPQKVASKWCSTDIYFDLHNSHSGLDAWCIYFIFLLSNTLDIILDWSKFLIIALWSGRFWFIMVVHTEESLFMSP